MCRLILYFHFIKSNKINLFRKDIKPNLSKIVVFIDSIRQHNDAKTFTKIKVKVVDHRQHLIFGYLFKRLFFFTTSFVSLDRKFKNMMLFLLINIKTIFV